MNNTTPDPFLSALSVESAASVALNEGTPPSYGLPASSVAEGAAACYLCGLNYHNRINWRGHFICQGCYAKESVSETVHPKLVEPKEHVEWIMNPAVFKRPEPPDHDPVNHPRHYTGHPSGIECIDVVEHMGFCLGNAIKYIWRADSKGKAVEDLRKAIWYIEREIQRREQPQDEKEEALNKQNK